MPAKGLHEPHQFMADKTRFAEGALTVRKNRREQSHFLLPRIWTSLKFFVITFSNL